MRDSYGGEKFASVVLILVPERVAAHGYAVLCEHPRPVVDVREEVPRRAARCSDAFATLGHKALCVVAELGGLPEVYIPSVAVLNFMWKERWESSVSHGEMATIYQR